MEKENRMAYEKAMEALKKQLGKAPVYKEPTNKHISGYYGCGVCGATVGVDEISSNYCPNCGYKVNWEEL